MNTLSLAGRVTLIKSVLISIPVYYMTVESMTTTTVNTINALIRKFLWGKVGKDRYLSLISWEKVCRKYEDGGLDIRDIKLFNKALLKKMTWQVAAKQDRLWVQVIGAKYFPRGGFWDIRSTTNASRFWKAIHGIKGELLLEVKWQVGDGQTINAVNQPWFQGWELQRIFTSEQANTTVAELFNFELQQWDSQKIARIMGSNVGGLIQQAQIKPVDQGYVQDRLIWLPSKSGNYTVKKGYNQLRNRSYIPQQHQPHMEEAWKKIWKWKWTPNGDGSK